jgi:hypothetical protein
MIQGEPIPPIDLGGFDMMDDIDADWHAWATQRTFAPIRRVGHVGWMMYGDHWIHPQCPHPLRQVIEDPMKINTSIRLVAHGVEDTFCVVWEDGSLRSQLQNHYMALQDVLENLTHCDITVSVVASHKSKQLTRAQQHLALSTQRSGDYFLYIQRSRGAFFQIPTKFIDILRDTLTEHGFQASDIWYQVTEPKQRLSTRQVIAEARRKNFLGDRRPAAVASASIYEVTRTTAEGTVENALAGFAACTVM